MSRDTLRAWYLVHKWTSLICTAFLLLLCLTGLPLIFSHEIDEAFSRGAPAAQGAERSLDELVAAGVKARPGVPLFLSLDDKEPVAYLTTGPTRDAKDADMKFVTLDRRTAQPLAPAASQGVMAVVLRLHTDLFAGLPGMLFLGAMGLLFAVATVSGVVVYAPFMRKLDFGTLRTRRSTRLKWLDYHNLLGVVTATWVLVVGLTGVVNTLATPIIGYWRVTELAHLTAANRGRPAPVTLVSVDKAVAAAKAAAPGMSVDFVAFPGGGYSTASHYAVFLHGGTPLTEKLLKPALVDAETGRLSAIASMPWYAQALLISQPLHFGDYGGLPLKILWALLDLAAIVVLGSGLYLWLGRRRPVEAKIVEVESGGVTSA
jgi:uncharacterized iron-regulated membrane protein